MSTAPKFTFDTEFRGENDVVSNAARARQKKTMTTEEIDSMCSRARNEGAKAGQVRAAENIDRSIAALTIALRAALDQSHADIESVRAEAADLALAIAARLAPAAIAALPEVDVQAALRELLHQALGEPRVTLSASPAVIEAITPKITDIASEEGYDGRVVLNPDAALTGADCRIEWRGGGAERNTQTIEQTIQSLFTHRFASSTPVKG
jgi:flagellar assembly protein FliH